MPPRSRQAGARWSGQVTWSSCRVICPWPAITATFSRTSPGSIDSPAPRSSPRGITTSGGIAPRRSARSSGERSTSWEETPSKSPARSCAGRGVRLRRPRTSRPTRKPTLGRELEALRSGTRAGVTPPRRSEHAPLRALALPSLRSSWPAGPCRRRDRKREGRCLRLRPSPCPGTVGPDRPGEARECPLLLRRRRRGRVPAPAG